jgi:uncharacterized RDD family membrane protein YckC
LFPQGVPTVSSFSTEVLPPPQENPRRPEPQLPAPQTSPSETATVRVPSPKESLTLIDRPPVDEQTQDWREELSKRVENYRKRRARFQPEADDSGGNLELDFGDIEKPQENRSLDNVLGDTEERDPAFDKPEGRHSLDAVLGVPEDRVVGFDLEIGDPAPPRAKDDQPGETQVLELRDDEGMQLDPAPAEAEEMSWGEPLPKNPPMEILVGTPAATAPEEDAEAEGILLATLGRRFLAGMTDALVLILGAAVFGVIFWRFCGRLSVVPLNIAVLGLAAVILIFAYFAVFAALTSSTPGLLWMGCEIRNLRGGPPTLRESFWRAFGVLVSLSALMLGFVWACVDSDRLTWHDRMSGTVITEER